MNIDRLKEQLKDDEGYRQHIYTCSAGKRTIGYGHNLDDLGADKPIADFMLNRDIEILLHNATINEIITGLDDVRAEVIINMAFNLGVGGLLNFRRMLAAVAQRNFEKAAAEMKDSLWYKQVGIRAKRLVKEMRTGRKIR